MIFLHQFLLILSIYQFIVSGKQPSNTHATYDVVYQNGVDAYKHEKWYYCSAFIQNALDDYKFYKDAVINCRLECRGHTAVHVQVNGTEMKLDSKHTFYENLIKKSVCLKKCRRKGLRHRQAEESVEELKDKTDIDEIFEQRKPYGYLHYCYYKLERYKEASAAAYTYFLSNQNDESALKSIHYYRTLDGVENEDFIDLERKIYQQLRLEAEWAHNDEKWEECRRKIEQAIKSYYKEEERCRAGCEESYSPRVFPDFDTTVADHYISVLICQFGCEEKLSVLIKDKEENYLAEQYNYLQFALYKLNHTDLAVEALATVQLLNPEDIDMMKNRAYYVMNMGYHEAQFIPRKEAVEYTSRRQAMEKLLEYVMNEYNLADEEDEEEDKDIISTENTAPSNANPSNPSNPGHHYMKLYERIGIRLKGEGKELSGQMRFVADGLLQEDQCEELVSIVKRAKPSDQVIRNITVPEIMEIAEDGEENEVALRMILRVSEVIRHYTGRYFNQTSFFIKEATIVCQHPGSDKDFPADCIQQSDGSCLQSDVIRQNKHYIGIIYLNDLKDGQLYFTDKEHIKQSTVHGACGRLVGLRASDIYGLYLPSKGERCALVLQFTTDRTENDPSHRKAMTQLHALEQTRKKVLHINRTHIVQKFEEEGLQVSMNESDLHGKERFVVDGLADEDQCRMLMELVQATALMGDGYKRTEKDIAPKSPHSKYEMFEGLTVSRAMKLMQINAINKEVVELYLDLSEKGRLWEENYFNLSSSLYFEFTHLVCRTALDDGTLREDLSHPVHADNCVIQTDDTCRKEFPAYIQRDYSALLYLNDDFEGGEFFFAYKNRTEQVSLRPKCGRMVGFNAGDYHGVKAVLKGQRCALAMWYTTDSSFKEFAHMKARRIIKQLEKQDIANSHDEL